MTYKEILKQYWGYDNFRGIQKEIIESIGNGHDTLGLMPTGGGKSITFQVPALAQPGLCLVITPLIALMKDQVRNLRDRGIKALAIYSGMTREEIIVALENCIFGGYTSKVYKSILTNRIYKVVDEFTPLHRGGYLVNGFGYQLHNITNSDISKVTILVYRNVLFDLDQLVHHVFVHM